MNTIAFEKLGFISSEKKEIVQSLNHVLANYQVHYQKLRNFHWNVKGPDFFDIHEQFEVDYNQAKEFIDVVAERIRTFGDTPYSTLQEYLEHSDIKEAGTSLNAREMVEAILNDYTVLMSFLVNGIQTSNENGDVSTSDLLVKELKRIEKRHWMFTSFISE